MIVLEPHPATKEELERFIGFLSTLSIRALKFTWEISETSVTFSRYQHFCPKQQNWQPVSTTNPQIRTVTCCTSSSHPSHVKDSIPYSQFLRLRRLCSEDSDFNSKCERNVSNFFSERGYPDQHLV